MNLKRSPFAIQDKNARDVDSCLLYTSDAADEGLGVDLGGRRIIKRIFVTQHIFITRFYGR